VASLDFVSENQVVEFIVQFRIRSVFRTTQCLSVQKNHTSLFEHFEDVGSQT